MRLPGNLGHLTYCINVHPTETWSEVRKALRGPARAVKCALSSDAPMTVGLRFSARALDDLREPGARAELKELLAEEDFEALTVNGFPYGRFHGVRVKEDVYQPDWRTEARLEYTCCLADLMADITPPGAFVSLSTVPGTFKPLGEGAEGDMADRMLRAVSHCMRLRERTGRIIALAIEPEPFCFLETIEESVTFFQEYLFSHVAVRKVAKFLGVSTGDVADGLPQHLGLCYDVCHAAVEFEDPVGSIATLRRAGIPIHKLQLSAALRLREATAEARAALAAFDEPTYLHQVVSRRGSELRREPDLPAALARGIHGEGEEWRVHFHVPVFIAELPAFSTTQNFLTEILRLHVHEPISPHLEIETYTWDVLPPELRTGTVDEAVTRELHWVLDRLSV